MARARNDGSIDPLRLNDQLKGGLKQRVWVVTGDEPFLVGRSIETLVDAGLAGASKSNAYEQLDGRDIKKGQLFGACMALTMFASTKVVLVRNAELLDKEGLRDEALEVVEKVPESTTLILQAGKLDKRTRLGKSLAKDAATVLCRPLYDRNIDAFLHAEALRHGKRITNDAARFLKEMGGRRLGDLASELGKAAIAAGEGDKIELEHVEGAADTRLDTIFEFLDAVGNRDLRNAVLGLDRLLDAGVAAPAITAGLARHLRSLLVARSLVDTGMSAEQAAREAGSKVAFRFTPQIRKNSVRRLSAALAAVMELDSAVKGGRLPDRLALERFVLKMARAPSAR